VCLPEIDTSTALTTNTILRPPIKLSELAARGDNLSMATATSIPLSEYLQTTYEPDCDYIDGELKERNMGEQPHGHLQTILSSIFHANRKTWAVRSLTESRVQTRPARFRIPYICILRSSDPRDEIIRFAPLVCIEILSKDDSLMDLQEKVNEFQMMGVEHIRIVDPRLRKGYVASSQGFQHVENGIFAVPGTPHPDRSRRSLRRVRRGLPRQNRRAALMLCVRKTSCHPDASS
jgi:Uma2 family endonuclease